MPRCTCSLLFISGGKESYNYSILDDCPFYGGSPGFILYSCRLLSKLQTYHLYKL